MILSEKELKRAFESTGIKLFKTETMLDEDADNFRQEVLLCVM